jgi:hypothetical protein
MVGDASVVIVRLSTPPSVAFELQAIGVGESFKVKLPDTTALEVGHKGSAFMCARRSAQLVAKCHRGTIVLPIPPRRLPNKVVPRRRFACPRLCSLHPLHSGASFGRC